MTVTVADKAGDTSTAATNLFTLATISACSEGPTQSPDFAHDLNVLGAAGWRREGIVNGGGGGIRTLDRL